MMRTLLAILITLVVAPQAMAQSAPVSLQGKLTGVPDGERQFTLRLWDQESGGEPKATVEGMATVTGGLFSLEPSVPASVIDGSTLWWSVEVEGVELPRQRVAWAPLAVRAGNLHIRAGGPLTTGTLNRFPPEGEILEGEWGGYLVGSNDDTRRVLMGVSNNGITKAEIGLINNNGDTGSIFFRTSPSNGAPSRQRMEIDEVGRVRIGAFPGSSRDGLLVVDGADAEAGGYPILLRNDSQAGLWMRLQSGGSAAPLLIDVDGERKLTFTAGGRMDVPVLRITGGSDLAEPFPAAPASMRPTPGMVLSIDPKNPGALRVSSEAYDTTVAGVYSGGNGLPTGMLMGKDGCELTTNGDDRLPLAMTGRVWVYADASGGEIRPGDRLTTSGANPGFAARVADASRADGAVIGKAMTGIDEATGMVLVLVNLQ